MVIDNQFKIKVLKQVVTTLKKAKKYEREGICVLISRNLLNKNVSLNDANKVVKWFQKQKPCLTNKYKEFAKNESFQKRLYWWGFDSKSVRQRILFAQHLITLLEEGKI